MAGRKPPDMHTVVLDTNVVLDLWVFDDPRFQGLSQAVQHEVRWIATLEMREEFARVLHYAHLARICQQRQLQVEQLLQRFDQSAQILSVAAKAPYTCKDPDDQKFIDLAVAHQASLYSKDKCVLAMRNRLARLNTPVCNAFNWGQTPI